MKKGNPILKIIYVIWPPFIRMSETLGFHNFRQKYIVGQLCKDLSKESLLDFLHSQGYEKALIAWRDPGEVLSVRKIDKKIFQYHIRLFKDGEIRAHYEYSPESYPMRHFFETHFVPKVEIFKELLKDFLI